MYRQKLTKEMLAEVEESFYSICDKETGTITPMELSLLLKSFGMENFEDLKGKGKDALLACGLGLPADEGTSTSASASANVTTEGEVEVTTTVASASSSASKESTSSVTIDIDFVIMLISYIIEGTSNWCYNEMEESFHVFDKDRRGFLDPLELKRVFIMLGEDLAEGDLLAQIDEFDIDGDRQMQLEEWIKMVSSTKGLDYVFDE